MLIYFVLTIAMLYCLFLSRITIMNDAIGSENEGFVFKSNGVLFIWYIILLYLAAFKGAEVGVDYPMYVSFFMHKTYIGLLEPGISFIYHLADKYNSFYVFSTMIYSIFLMFIFYAVKKNTPNYLISIFLFIIMHIYFNSFNQVRQLVAVSIIFCFAHLVSSEKKFDRLKYIFVVLIAMLFHDSAIFMFVLIFIPRKKWSPKMVIPLFFVTIVLYFLPSVKNSIGELLISIAGAYGEKYASGYVFFGVNKEKGFIQLIPVMIQMIIVSIALYIPKFNEHLNINYKLYIFSMNAVIINLWLYALAGIEAVDRLQIYFSCFNIYFYAYLIHHLLNKKKLLDQLFVFLIIAFWILYYILRLLINVHGIVPYSFLI
ncbi:EpsG family protein [Robertmurraya sp. 2P01SA]|uniref:EpsG family protein n=2 Tax=Robertmurraya TaxID=2837507 RepID=UPI0039A5CA9E